MNRSFALLLVFFLSGCGFRLAGSRALPPELDQVYIDVVTPYSVSEPPLEAALQRLLQRRGSRIATHPGPGTTVLQLSQLTEGREVLSLGLDGKALEYQLVSSVNYSLHARGQPLLTPGTLRVTRDYSFNAQQILAKEAEEQRLREFIQGELAELVMLRIDAVLLQQATEGRAPAATLDATPPP